VSKNCPYSNQIGLQFDNQIRFWSGLFGGGAAESYDRFWVEIGGPISTCVLDVGAIRDIPVLKADVKLLILSG
jgi:hypothetical protein